MGLQLITRSEFILILTVHAHFLHIPLNYCPDLEYVRSKKQTIKQTSKKFNRNRNESHHFWITIKLIVLFIISSETDTCCLKAVTIYISSFWPTLTCANRTMCARESLASVTAFYVRKWKPYVDLSICCTCRTLLIAAWAMIRPPLLQEICHLNGSSN